MRQDLIAKMAASRPTIFDEWPKPPASNEPIDEVDDEMYVGMTDLRKMRLQMTLAVNPLGVPSLAFCDAYKRIFGRQLDIKQLGFEHLAEMIASLPDVFTVQEPDSGTSALFKDYPRDKILHDARLGLNFHKQDLDGDSGYGDHHRGPDPNDLINTAWLMRDDDFPPDVILPGEEYSDLILPLTSANIPGTRGLHKALIIGSQNPSYIFVNIKSDATDRIDQLSSEITHYFSNSKYPIDSYSVPREFVVPNFPCLVYQPKGNFWERAEIVGRSPKGGRNKILIKTVDYGEEFNVSLIFLYLIPRVFFDIPRQGIAVSLAGVRPNGKKGKWGSSPGRRIRCFSNPDYWLDCLLLDPKPQSTSSVVQRDPNTRSSTGSSSCLSTCTESTGAVQSGDTSAEAANDDAADGKIIKKRKRSGKKSIGRVDFELIACDRFDSDLNLYLDDVLAMETYVDYDSSRRDEITCLKQKMEAALDKMPRPKNPMSHLGDTSLESSIEELKITK